MGEEGEEGKEGGVREGEEGKEAGRKCDGCGNEGSHLLSVNDFSFLYSHFPMKNYQAGDIIQAMGGIMERVGYVLSGEVNVTVVVQTIEEKEGEVGWEGGEKEGGERVGRGGIVFGDKRGESRCSSLPSGVGEKGGGGGTVVGETRLGSFPDVSKKKGWVAASRGGGGGGGKGEVLLDLPEVGGGGMVGEIAGLLGEGASAFLRAGEEGCSLISIPVDFLWGEGRRGRGGEEAEGVRRRLLFSLVCWVWRRIRGYEKRQLEEWVKKERN